MENAFGILSSRFRIFLSTVNLAPDKVETVTLASIVLRQQSADSLYSKLDTEELNHGVVREGTRRRQQMTPLERIPRRPTEQAKNVRNAIQAIFQRRRFAAIAREYDIGGNNCDNPSSKIR